MEVKINKKKLNENKERKKRQGFMIPGDYEIYARACLYLNEKEESIEYFNKASNEVDVVIKTYEKRNELENVVKEKHIKANYLRLADKKEESQKLYKEVKELYEKVLPSDYKKNIERWCTIVTYYADVFFFLKEYEQCIQIGEQVTLNIPISAKYAKAILNKDNEEIKNIVNDIIEDGKSTRLSPGTDSNCTTALWDWYEIGLQLLGLPSRIDYIKE